MMAMMMVMHDQMIRWHIFPAHLEDNERMFLVRNKLFLQNFELDPIIIMPRLSIGLVKQTKLTHES